MLYNPQEFNDMYAEPFRIMRFSSKKVTKRYSFEKTDVPDCSEYLEVKYSVRRFLVVPEAVL